MTTPTIPILTIGYKRTVGLNAIPPVFEGTPYVITAFFDIVETPEPYNYSPHNLAVALRALHPRPRALVVGHAVSVSLVDEIERVWGEYVEEALKSETDDWRRSVVVSLPRTHAVDPSLGPPKVDGAWAKEMMGQLDAVFRSG
ncbi:hypothetical protein BO71DRAFT_362375 [Aspergillus ellipticus CBS 707.79]|uniref:Uncharacterized protein n=1 Tax=Aspergillus ellipticus CBS 707.79 TaxID=1448320 RepID=A0A319CYM6_9EURO|nr:hypothetical protein BO71DRAFT_362375 [Aspergillus ellipticus CBS 707.79]